MDRVNFSHLYYFYVVAKEGSIKGASEKLFVTQPTISDQIKLLEEFFECRLFERRNRSLFLTKEGELALDYCDQIFDLGNEMTNRLRNKIRIPKESVDIGITKMMSHYFLYDLILPILGEENRKINFKENDRHLLLAELEEEDIDVVFTDSKDGLPKNMTPYRVGENKTFVVAHKKFKGLKKGFPKSLSEAPFFNYTSNSFLKHEIEMFFLKYGITSKNIGEADDIDLLELITKKGLAFTIVPEVAKNRFCQDNEIIVLGEIKELQTSVWAIVKNEYQGVLDKIIKF